MSSLSAVVPLHFVGGVEITGANAMAMMSSSTRNIHPGDLFQHLLAQGIHFL